MKLIVNRQSVVLRGRMLRIHKLFFSNFFLFHAATVLLSVFIYYFLDKKPTAASIVFDLYIIVALFYCIFKTNSFLFKSLSFWALLVFLVVHFLNYFVFNSYGYESIYDFLRSIRFLLYLLIYIVISECRNTYKERVKVVETESFVLFAKTIISVFFIVYLVQMAIGSERPRFFSENNYEIPLLLSLMSINEYLSKKRNVFFSGIAYLTALISFSKSGLLEASYVYLRFFLRDITARKIAYLLVITFIGGYVILMILISRVGGQDLVDIDRFKFFLVFWDLMVESNYGEIFLGHGMASSLPFTSCIELKYWANDIFSDYSYCNATVFHSFLLKLVYECGILGSLLIIYAWYYYIIRDYGRWLGRVLFTIVIICSLSVSGFGNSIVIWILFLGLFINFSFDRSCSDSNNSDHKCFK